MSLIEIREQDVHFFPKEMVKKVCSDYKQNIVLLIDGGMGTGKSYTAIEMALLCSQYLSKRLGGNPRDYFNINDNLGCMNIEEITNVYDKMKVTKHGVFIIDDASPVISARKFNSPENQAQNNMLITMRPNENILIMTTPQKFLIDKVPRQLSGYIAHMKKPYFKYGYTCADIRKLDMQSDGRMFEPYLQNNRGEKFKLHLFRKPPKELTDIYDERRQNAQDELARQSVETLLKKPEEKIPKTKKSDLYKQIYEEFKNGKYGDMSLKEVCRLKKIPYQSVLNAQGS